jgi:uncharacterized protein (DUF2236 family)
LNLVSDSEFEAGLLEIRKAQQARHQHSNVSSSNNNNNNNGNDDDDGVFGRGSMSWRVGRESVAFVAGLRAALLQLAHPYVATGVKHHSNVKHGIHMRFYRTFKVCCSRPVLTHSRISSDADV